MICPIGAKPNRVPQPTGQPASRLTAHLVLFCDGAKFEPARDNLTASFPEMTSHPTRIHLYDMKRIRSCSWFARIEHLPAFLILPKMHKFTKIQDIANFALWCLKKRLIK